MDNQRDDILVRLEQVAEVLDALEYPGEAWSVADQPSPRLRVWRVAGLIATIAASVAALIYFAGMRPRDESVPESQGVAVQEPASTTEEAPEEVPVPTIIVVEDYDSYSFIDLTADVPLVSFAKKDTYMPEYAVPLWPDATMPLPSEEEM